MDRSVRRVLLLALLILLGAPLGQDSFAQEPEAADSAASVSETSRRPLVYVVEWADAITPVTRDFLVGELEDAEREEADAFLIVLDTPGGLLDTTRDIVSRIFDSSVPVIVWVGPSGARAASAGTFITLAAHVAAMAPGTNIGAASPVTMGGGGVPDSTLGHKMFNDAAAFARTIAERRGRNVEWAESTVREAAASTESEALAAGAIDFVAKDRDEVLALASGRTVETPDGERVLALEKARLVERELSLRYRLLSLLANPNIAYFLLILGFYGVFFELSNPGSIFPGVVGAIFLILAFFSLQTLPMNLAGLLLIIVGTVLFILEVKITSYGLLTLGGITATVLGAIMLFDSPEPALRASLGVILPLTIVTSLLFAVAVGLSIRTFRSRPTTGQEGMVGLRGEVRTSLAPRGTVEIRGEIWWALADETIPEGQTVEVVGVEGLLLKVRRA
jgi:membrane-bound serine protease (ClpP class)